jgi:trk system potassium uptake protein TrkH
MKVKNFLSPIAFPILFFAGIICIGTILLHSSFCLRDGSISWLDAMFTATSATCVTGLSVVDIGTFFTLQGHIVILCLIQLGGLGIMTFTSLAFYLWRRRITITDRLAVGQSLLHDPSFHLGHFLKRIVFWTFLVESCGALLIFIQQPRAFPLFSSIFHSISAFCNAGFSLRADSLVSVRGHWGLNLVFIFLIISGGLGFSVLVEGQSYLAGKLRNAKKRVKFSWYSMTVIKTTVFLIVAGFIGIYLAEYVGLQKNVSGHEAILTALFQSVTCRTAGFNTLEIARMTNVSLFLMIILMFIGGAPGSCAGGIKVTTFRVLWAMFLAEVKGREQVVIGKFAVDKESLNNALSLFVYAGCIILISTFILDFTEGGDIPHLLAGGQFLEILFEVVSAFDTVGLSTGLTPKLSMSGRVVILMLMFVGRLGPLVFLAALQNLRTRDLFLRPEEKILIG